MKKKNVSKTIISLVLAFVFVLSTHAEAYAANGLNTGYQATYLSSHEMNTSDTPDTFVNLKNYNLGDTATGTITYCTDDDVHYYVVNITKGGKYRFSIANTGDDSLGITAKIFDKNAYYEAGGTKFRYITIHCGDGQRRYPASTSDDVYLKKGTFIIKIQPRNTPSTWDSMNGYYHVEGKADYSFSLSLINEIKTTKIRKVYSDQKGTITVEFDKVPGAIAYQIDICYKKNFTVSDKTTTKYYDWSSYTKVGRLKKIGKKKYSYTNTHLKSNKKFYVRVRPLFRILDFKYLDGIDWSKTKSVKTK